MEIITTEMNGDILQMKEECRFHSAHIFRQLLDVMVEC